MWISDSAVFCIFAIVAAKQLGIVEGRTRRVGDGEGEKRGRKLEKRGREAVQL